VGEQRGWPVDQIAEQRQVEPARAPGASSDCIAISCAASSPATPDLSIGEGDEPA
jgi:hypothetical protein